MTAPTETDGVVLVVEDESELADLFTDWLAEAYEVRTAYDGEEALERYDEEVDVALLDRRMPGVSGDELLDRIRERPGDCRVAMVTAITPDFDDVEMPFDDYLVKPISKDELLETTERLLTRSNYDRKLQEYFALASKRATLEAGKSHTELVHDERYEELTAELDKLQSELDAPDHGAVFEDCETADGRNDEPSVDDSDPS